MPAVPETKATWTDGVDALSSTNLHAYLRDPIAFLMHKPAAKLRASVLQSIPSGAFTPVTFNLEDLDDDPDGVGGHSTVSNTSRYTARYPGWYRMSGGVTWSPNATGRRGTQWTINGAALAASQEFRPGTSAGAVTSQATSMLVYLYEGDYLELQAWQDSGAALSTFASSANQSYMTVEWVSI